MASSVVGAQLFTLREHTKTIRDIRSTLKKVAGIGYKAVQISGFGPAEPKEVAAAVKDAGLVVGATHVGWQRFQTELDRVIEEHKLWKCTHPAIGGLPGEYRGADGLARFIAELPPVAEKLATHGMDFSYHNHAHEFVRIDGRKTWLEVLYERTSPRHLKAELDVHWIQTGGGDPAAWIRRYPGRQPLLHLKDYTIGEKGERRFAEIGEGNMNWPAILAAAREAGVEWYLVEQDDCYGRDPFESLALSLRNLEQMGL